MAMELNHVVTSSSHPWGHLEVHLQKVGNRTGSLGLPECPGCPVSFQPTVEPFLPITVCALLASPAVPFAQTLFGLLLVLSEIKLDTWNKKE